MDSRILVFGIILSVGAVYTEESLENYDDEQYSQPPYTNTDEPKLTNEKDGLTNENLEIIQQILSKHVQSLEDIVNKSAANEETVRQIVENSRKRLDKLYPVEYGRDKIRRSGSKTKLNQLKAVRKIDAVLPRYYELLKHIIVNEVKEMAVPEVSDDDNEALGEEAKEITVSGRRFYSEHENINESQTQSNNDEKISPWCSIAALCKRNSDPTCGYDNTVGYRQFEDLCQMLQTNCYWKCNFAVVTTCGPIQ